MLLGKPDAELMKKDVAAALDTSKSEDERIAALDHLEMVRFRPRYLFPGLVLILGSIFS